MRIEIFVVTTELDRNIARNAYWTDLEALKAEMIRQFGGLTETGIETGYWWDNGKICSDIVKRWIIYTDSDDCYLKIKAFAKSIKKLTSQKSQAFGIDGKMFYV